MLIGPIPRIVIPRSPRRRPGRATVSRVAVVGIAGFGQASITEVFRPLVRGGQVFLSWSSSAGEGTYYQVYLNGALAWTGQSLFVWVPVPIGPVRIDIGTVGAGLENLSQASSLPAGPTRRAKLTWVSGTYHGLDLAGFRVYGGTAPGGPVSFAAVLATITAYPAGIVLDGWGIGGFGGGGFGLSPGAYDWTSDPLSAGTWSFAVVPFDNAGNTGTPITTTATIAAPPREPAVMADGVTRLSYSLSGGAAALNWLASPA